MSNDRLSRTDQTWALAFPEAFADPLAPTAAELNDAEFVHKFSCALTEDGTSLELADSDTNTTLTFCSIGNESTPTFKNPTAVWTGLRDADKSATGLFNKLRDFLLFADVPFYVISRTGPADNQDLPFAIGHKIKYASFNTDRPVDMVADGEMMRLQQNFLFDGTLVNWNYTIES